MAHERTARLAASPPMFESRFLDFFSRVHPVGPGDRLRAGRGRWLIWLGIDHGLGASGRRSCCFARRARHLDADRVLAAPAALPLGAEVPRRRPPPLHHPRRPPRPSERRDAPGDAPRASASRWPRSSSGSSCYLRNAAPPSRSSPASSLGYLTYDYMHYHVHHHVPKTKFGKRLRTQHMRHHFQDHRYGFGVSSPLWDASWDAAAPAQGRRRRSRGEPTASG